MIATPTLAHLYEAQGHKEDALKIYQSILEKDPANKEAKIAIGRLKGERKKYAGVNEQMLAFFISMNTDVEFAEFERWLLLE